MVKKSIEDYGYNRYIVVDNKNVVVVGHTRLIALKELGWKKAKVFVLDKIGKKEVKEYRIVDNKTQEYSNWTEKLSNEIKSLKSFDSMSFYFDDLDSIIKKDVGIKNKDVTDDNIEDNKENLSDYFNKKDSKRDNRKIQATCPACGNQFFVS